ncbi:MAG: hypothetical protein EOL91_13345 [Actinobacteria bacterium]|nr:hypothetical protein [Actinomycetota bacterium]
MDLATLTDPDLDALRVNVLNEQDRRRLLIDAPGLVEQINTRYEDAVANIPHEEWATITARTDRVGPGVRVTLAGIEYRNKSGAWLPISAGPDKDPSSIWWERVTPVDPGTTYPEWSPDEQYGPATPGIRDEPSIVTRNGRVYEALAEHGASYAGTWGPPTVGAWKDLGPA